MQSLYQVNRHHFALVHLLTPKSTAKHVVNTTTLPNVAKCPLDRQVVPLNNCHFTFRHLTTTTTTRTTNGDGVTKLHPGDQYLKSNLKCLYPVFTKGNECLLRRVTHIAFTNETATTLNATRKFVSDARSAKQVVPFNLSDIGEGIAEVTLKEWYIEVGQKVNQFDSICEVQSDKASVTITSKFDGVIKKIYYSVDEIAKVGQPLVDIEIDMEDASASSHLVDEINDQDAYKKSSTEANISSSSHHSFNSCDGSNLTSTSNLDSYKKTLATPAVRRLAMENQINLSDIKGTGKDGRVMKEDILAFIETRQSGQIYSQDSSSDAKKIQSPVVSPLSSQLGSQISSQINSPPSSPPPPPPSSPSMSAGLPRQRQLSRDETVKVSPVTRGMIKSMTASLSIPHLGLSDEVDVTQLINMKPVLKRVSQERSGGSVKITFLPIMIKAASLALTQFPLLNSVLSESDDAITYKAHHNIGFAMDTPIGLIVPNIKSVQNLSIYEIALEINRLMAAGSRGQLSNNDLTGGTFTLSNIGSIGGSFGIPLILPPQVAIGAIGRIKTVPRFASSNSDLIVRASILQVLWSADHRIVDGATIANFNNHWKCLLEDPYSMLIDLK